MNTRFLGKTNLMRISLMLGLVAIASSGSALAQDTSGPGEIPAPEDNARLKTIMVEWKQMARSPARKFERGEKETPVFYSSTQVCTTKWFHDRPFTACQVAGNAGIQTGHSGGLFGGGHYASVNKTNTTHTGDYQGTDGGKYSHNGLRNVNLGRTFITTESALAAEAKNQEEILEQIKKHMDSDLYRLKFKKDFGRYPSPTEKDEMLKAVQQGLPPMDNDLSDGDDTDYLRHVLQDDNNPPLREAMPYVQTAMFQLTGKSGDRYYGSKFAGCMKAPLSALAAYKDKGPTPVANGVGTARSCYAVKHFNGEYSKNWYSDQSGSREWAWDKDHTVDGSVWGTLQVTATSEDKATLLARIQPENSRPSATHPAGPDGAPTIGEPQQIEDLNQPTIQKADFKSPVERLFGYANEPVQPASINGSVAATDGLVKVLPEDTGADSESSQASGVQAI